ESFDHDGRTTSRSTSWRAVLWPRRQEVRDAQDRYTTLTDQVLLTQKELMRLGPGYRFVRCDRITPVPEYVPMTQFPWPTLGDRRHWRTSTRSPAGDELEQL